MKRKLFVSFVVIIILLTMCLTASAEQKTVTVSPNLYFVGTTANCSVMISIPGKYIDATLTLKYGNTEVDSWHKTGNGYVYIYGTANAVSGRTYSLEVTGTIGGESINSNPVSVMCP